MYHGEYTLQETVILTQLNLNMQARDLERMVLVKLQQGGLDSGGKDNTKQMNELLLTAL